ncbi:MAG: carboxypeptidase-like regulatory domain-containing protein, partial [Bacteroidota bacterium]
MKRLNYCTTLILLFLSQFIIAQNTQTIRGTILDQQSEVPLIGVAIELISVEPIIGTATDLDGNFELIGIPLGRHTIRLSYIGYETSTIPNVIVDAGKETVLNLSLEESLVQIDEVVVTGAVEKDRTNNDMATISARSFNLEEVTRYSGGRNDVARLASNFAGVAVADDSRNDIVIRGNSPTGVLWQLEGIPIPNPNHFSTLGTTGGPVSALNPNLLDKSDFLTSAF